MKVQKSIPFITFFCVLILPSPIVFSLGISQVITSMFIFICGFIIYILKSKKNISFLFLSIIFIGVGFGLITSFHYVNMKYTFILLSLFSNAFLYNCLNLKEKEIFIKYSTSFLLLLEVFAVIGFVYTWFGGNPIYSFKNPDGRNNDLYLTTFSNLRLGKIIRPSGIYDEPGAFSFFIISICILRLKHHEKLSYTVLMLLFGCITLSLTHIICMFVLFIVIRKQFSLKEKILFMFFIICVLLFLIICFWDIADRMIFSRLKFDTSKGTFNGDNRSGQINNSIKILEQCGFLFGSYEVDIRKYGDVSSNPLSLLAINGLFNSIIYYSFIILCFILSTFFHNLLFLSILLLFLQRPYQNLIGYSFFFVYFLDISIFTIKKKLYSMNKNDLKTKSFQAG